MCVTTCMVLVCSDQKTTGANNSLDLRILTWSFLSLNLRFLKEFVFLPACDKRTHLEQKVSAISSTLHQAYLKE